MKRQLILTLFAALALTTLAQEVSDGFYRVQNYGTQRYAYVYDNTGSINVQNTSADMGAIVLYHTPEKRLTDPASVIYISNKGKSSNYYLYDLEAQGTGVHKIINFYVNVFANTNIPGTYYVYETQYSQYLNDPVSYTQVDRSYVSTKPVSDDKLRCWRVLPVSSTTDEYLGVAPDATMKVGTKYYTTYYFGFAMDLAGSNMKAYYVSDVKPDAVIIRQITGTIPAATPVILESTSTDGSSNRLIPIKTSPANITDNQLTGNYFCYEGHGPTAYKEYDPTTMRLLTVKDGRLRFISDTNNQRTTALEFKNGTKVTVRHCIPANCSYLQVPAGTPAELPVMTQEEYDALHPATKKGDINADGIVNSTDALVLYRIIASGE